MDAMALVLIATMLVGLVLIATESLNHINKAAVAVFAGVSCWLIFIANGADIVRIEYAGEYGHYLLGQSLTSANVKDFISSHIFFRYIVKCANIVLFLLATTSIVEVLNNNGCFDFLHEWLRTRRPRKLLWMLAFFTFIISANLDNLTTVVLMLSIIHPLLQTDKQRRVYGTVVILAANCGGAITVIGDLTSLKLWDAGLVTPSIYFLKLAIPVLAALAVMLWLIGRNLPTRIELSFERLPYRGDDTLLSRSQRLLMLFVGMGGLWFIPSFHRITHLPPFLGAFCVLALLWMVNELCNRQLLGSDKMVLRRLPMALQYANLQNVLYFVGLTLMFGAVAETGIFHYMSAQANNVITLTPCVAFVGAVLSALFGNVPVLLGSVDILSQLNIPHVLTTDVGLWPALSYATSMGGSMLLTGSIAGVLLMRMEGLSFRWYLRHITPKVVAGYAVGYVIIIAMMLCGLF